MRFEWAYYDFCQDSGLDIKIQRALGTKQMYPRHGQAREYPAALPDLIVSDIHLPLGPATQRAET
jgi:hypothetical protein